MALRCSRRRNWLFVMEFSLGSSDLKSTAGYAAIRQRAMAGWTQPEIRDGRMVNSWEEIEAALAEDRDALKLLSQITNGTIFDFNLDYKDGFEKIKIFHLSSLKRSAQKLSAAAMDDLHRGDSASAVKSVSTMLTMVNGESHDRILISELVRIAIAAIGVGATWDVLQATNVSDEGLARFQQDWQSLEFTAPIEQAMIFERIQQLEEFVETRTSSEKFNEFWGYFYAPNAPEPDISQFGVPMAFAIFAKVGRASLAMVQIV